MSIEENALTTAQKNCKFCHPNKKGYCRPLLVQGDVALYLDPNEPSVGEFGLCAESVEEEIVYCTSVAFCPKCGRKLIEDEDGNFKNAKEVKK